MANPSMHIATSVKIHLALSGSLSPIGAAALAFASHFALDYFPEYFISPDDPDRWDYNQSTNIILEAIALSLIVVYIWPGRILWMTLTILAGMLPDLIDLVVERFTGMNFFPCHNLPRVDWPLNRLFGTYEFQTCHISAFATGVLSILFVLLALFLGVSR